MTKQLNDAGDAPAAFGSRAMEFALSSTQQVTDTANRLVRTLAGAPLGDGGGAFDAAALSPWRALSAPWQAVSQLQRSAFEFGLTAWVDWMRAVGDASSAAAGAGTGVTASATRGWNPERAVAAAPRRAPVAKPDRPTASSRRSPAKAERAVAAAGSKPSRSGRTGKATQKARGKR